MTVSKRGTRFDVGKYLFQGVNQRSFMLTNLCCQVLYDDSDEDLLDLKGKHWELVENVPATSDICPSLDTSIPLLLEKVTGLPDPNCHYTTSNL